jgi:C4-dicarboxylate-specific signal transduction histidine kinase/CheY-like chemotaxis protein
MTQGVTSSVSSKPSPQTAVTNLQVPTFSSASRPPALRTGRLLCAMCAVAYPLYWATNHFQPVPYFDPLAPRVVVSLACLLLLGATYVSAYARKHFASALVGLVYVITTHIFALLIANDLDQQLVIGTLVVLAGFIATATYTISTRRQLVAYVGYSGALAVVAVTAVKAPHFAPTIFLLSVSVVLAMAFVSVDSHMGTLGRLVHSERLLRSDVEEREASEARLRRSEARANALLDAIPDVLLRLSRGGRIVDVRNDEASLLGGQLRECLGAPLDRFLGAGSTRIAEAVASALESGKIGQVDSEVTVDGERHKLEIRVVPSSPEECLALARDVTQEREVDARLRVAERLASLGTLASGVAHEINNPLSYVVANVDYVLEALEKLPEAQLEPIGGDDLLQALREIREGGRRIGTIVASLKHQARQDDAQAAPADANEAVESALRILDNQLRYKTRVELALGRIPNALVHPQRLVQVVVNLLANALDAFPERSSDQNVVRVETRAERDGLVLEVKDNGTGIPESVRGRIFDPFFTTKAPGVGTGLGLYLCHQYVMAVGGTIDVESREGQGTTFRVKLLAAHGMRQGDVDPVATPLAPSRILVVDDEPLVARSIARMLRGHELVMAGDGEAALWECLSRDFDLILCDVMMPRMDGSAFYESLKDHRPKLAARVVFMTGGAFTPGTRAFLDRVPNARIEKPIQAHRLFDAARRQLATAQEQEPSRPEAHAVA